MAKQTLRSIIGREIAEAFEAGIAHALIWHVGMDSPAAHKRAREMAKKHDRAIKRRQEEATERIINVLQEAVVAVAGDGRG